MTAMFSLLMSKPLREGSDGKPRANIDHESKQNRRRQRGHLIALNSLCKRVKEGTERPKRSSGRWAEPPGRESYGQQVGGPGIVDGKPYRRPQKREGDDQGPPPRGVP